MSDLFTLKVGDVGVTKSGETYEIIFVSDKPASQGEQCVAVMRENSYWTNYDIHGRFHSASWATQPDDDHSSKHDLMRPLGRAHSGAAA